MSRQSDPNRSLGYVSAIDSNGRTIFVADAHRDDGKRFVVQADEKLTAFLELASAVCIPSGDETGNSLRAEFCFFRRNALPNLVGESGHAGDSASISADDCQFDDALLQRLSDARGNEALSKCIDPADSDKQSVLRRERFSLLDDRRNHRTIFEHELQLRSVITAGYDLLAAKPVPNRAMLRGMSTRRRSYSSAIQLAEVRH